MKKIWILIQTNGYGEVLDVMLFTSEYDAQTIMWDEYEKDKKQAEEDESLVDFDRGYTWAYVDHGEEEIYRWEYFEREIPE